MQVSRLMTVDSIVSTDVTLVPANSGAGEGEARPPDLAPSQVVLTVPSGSETTYYATAGAKFLVTISLLT